MHGNLDAVPAISAQQVTKIFGVGPGSVTALDKVSIDIQRNEFFTLLGPSGCGKTTMLRLIAGFDHPTSGRIDLEGSDISYLPPFRRPVNTVFQSYALFPHMSVAENIGFGLKMLGKSTAEIDAEVDAMLKLVKMEAMRDRSTAQISGGQQQRVALARALAPKPKVLLLDEPLSALDLKLRKEMQIELKRLQHETGITFVFVTHDQEEALTMSDRIAVMSAGKVLQVGSPRDIYDRPSRRFVADFIGDTNFIDADLVSTGKGASNKASLKLASGKQIAASLPDGDIAVGRVTAVVRPEHASLTKPQASSALTGTLETVVYFGTDTHYHVSLTTGGTFTVRMQNARGQDGEFAEGDKVGINVDAGATQVLRD